jgi:hypothetical protein
MVDVPIIVAIIAGKIDRVLQRFERRKFKAISLLIDIPRYADQLLIKPMRFRRLMDPGYARNADTAVLIFVCITLNRCLGLIPRIAECHNCIQFTVSEGATPNREWFNPREFWHGRSSVPKSVLKYDPFRICGTKQQVWLASVPAKTRIASNEAARPHENEDTDIMGGSFMTLSHSAACRLSFGRASFPRLTPMPKGPDGRKSPNGKADWT